MLADDQKYFSWMARAALAVLMTVIMFWIRRQVPDTDAATAAYDATASQTATTEHASFPAMSSSTGLIPTGSLVRDASAQVGIVTHR